MKRNILDVKIDSITFSEAIRKIDKLIVAGKPSQVVTVNPEMVMAAQKDREFRQIINSAELAVPDGAGIIWAGKFLGKPFRERITGVDLTWAICKLAEDRGYSVFFLGGKNGAARKTAQRVRKISDRLKISGFYPGRPGDPQTIDKIKKSKPDILFVAFGAPKQEKFIHNLLHKFSDFGLHASRCGRISDLPQLCIGVGGTFDYIAGIVPYPPEWIRKLGFEWLFRLFTQPWRWNRIITAIIRFPWAVIKEKVLK